MALEFVGMKDGKPKVFSVEELGEWLVDKVNRYMNPDNAKKCAEYVLAHNGQGGGIGKGNKLDGTESIFHISHGVRNKSEGCSVFFSTRDGGKHAVIVGIGWHYKNQDDEYKLDYKHGTWNMANGTIVKL